VTALDAEEMKKTPASMHHIVNMFSAGAKVPEARRKAV
jgi:hypothetical protein